ncbi:MULTISPECIES: hypothetical protein [Flavobacterium]|uniref:Tetratricopeptide repeat protein n=1 Tax=Flavobacterium lipolyticum TaxID=2893754 RepID=A0ABS8LX73_9FLAO|nr:MULTISPECIES: hypothetical protein [unclassified Flavobacterium]MCC9016566.1 hypothetical protein [Flavobacterium sp. F-126]
MKKKLFFIVLLISFKSFAQNNPKIAFQKSRYELALDYYEKADYKKAIDLFYIAFKIKPDNEIGQESIKKVDTLRTVLREHLLKQAIGTWKMVGDKPVWAANQNNAASQKDFEELIEIKDNEISSYEKNKKTQEKKLIKSEKLVYYNKEKSDALFSDIILSDGTVWNCTINGNELHVINVAKKGDGGIEKITDNNTERFYIKVE